jgi:hypothetical protein
MDKFVLFISDQGDTDVLDFHPDKGSAHKALAEYVTKKTGRALPSDPEAAGALIDSYFDCDRTFYTIAGVPAGGC